MFGAEAAICTAGDLGVDMEGKHDLPQWLVDRVEQIFEAYGPGHGDCVSRCKSTYYSCISGCPDPPDPTGCREGCRSALESCINGCPDRSPEKNKQLIEQLEMLDREITGR